VEPYTQAIEVGDDLSEVGRVQEELSGLWERRGLPAEVEATVSLALEEVLSNVLRHGQGEKRSCEIRVTFQVDSAGFEFEVSDSAAEYNPLVRPDPDVSLPLEKRRPGGLGVFLVKRLADEISYSRSNGRNHLRFRKGFGDGSPEQRA
jgi:anti-sigma regulatory factor (Ser/Thr protein kinase)